MKHAGPDAIRELSDLVSAVRARGPKEPRPGVFYRRGKAWLHFHEDKAGLFADIRAGGEWQRFPVSDAAGRAGLLAFIDRELGASSPGQAADATAPGAVAGREKA